VNVCTSCANRRDFQEVGSETGKRGVTEMRLAVNQEYMHEQKVHFREKTAGNGNDAGKRTGHHTKMSCHSEISSQL